MTNYKDAICKCGHALEEHVNMVRHNCCTHEDCTCDGFVLAPPIPKFVPQTTKQIETLEQFMQKETATLLYNSKKLYWTDLENSWVVVHKNGGREVCDNLQTAFEIMRG